MDPVIEGTLDGIFLYSSFGIDTEAGSGGGGEGGGGGGAA